MVEQAEMTNLETHPELAAQFTKWGELTSVDWVNLLMRQPQFAEHCDKWDRFDSLDWAWLLAEQPQFAGRCNFEGFSKLGIEHLLEKQPQFAEKFCELVGV